MRVLFVTLNALEVNTSVTVSNIGILKGLKEMGADITLIMPEISKDLSYYDNRCNLEGYNIIRIPDNVSTYIAASNSTKWKAKLKSIISFFYSKLKIYDRGTLLLGKSINIDVFDNYYDFVISTSDPKSSHLFVKQLKKNGLKYGKWIQHWGDPMYGDITGKTVYPRFVIKHIERRLLRESDKIIYVSPLTLKQQKRVHSKEKDKMHFVPLPCDEDYFSDKETNIGKMTVSYLGDYSSSVRNIMPLYNACKNNKNIRLIIAGNTDLSLAEAENITIYPRVSYEKVKEIEADTHIYISINNLRGTQIPGKIYYVAASHKPILVIMEKDYYNEMEEYLAEFGRFITCRNDIVDIEKTLDSCIDNLDKKYLCPERLLPKNVANMIIFS